MKKALVVLLSILVLLSVLTGCGANKNSYETAFSYSSSAPSAPPATYALSENLAKDEMGLMRPGESMMNDYDDISTVMTSGAGSIVRTEASTFEKIIYSAEARIETVDFDKSVSDVYVLLDAYGGFIENSYIGGANYYQKYYDYQTYRNAQFTLRVPVSAFNTVIGALETLGNVTSRSSNAENITAQFTDNESRLATYRTEETRLLAMLEKADTVADMITIETRLSEVRYQIESITSQLKNWQNQVDYSTVNIWLDEVEKLSEQVPVKRSYWQQIGDGLTSTLKDIGRFFTELLKWLVVNLPILIILAAICVVIIIVVRRMRKKHRKPDIDKQDSGKQDADPE